MFPRGTNLTIKHIPWAKNGYITNENGPKKQLKAIQQKVSR